MRTFQEVQNTLDSIGFSANLEPFNQRIKGNLALSVPGVIFVLLYPFLEASSAQKYMESVYVATAATAIGLSIVSTIVTKKKIFSLIESVDEFSNASQLDAHRSILERTNESVEKWSKIGLFASKYVLVPCFICPRAIVSFFIYFTTDSGSDAFDLPLPMWLPYDWRSPTAYSITVFLQIVLMLFPLNYIGCTILLAFGTFTFSIAFVKIQKGKLRSMNKMASDKRSRKTMWKTLSKFVWLNSEATQMIASFADFFKIHLMIVFLGVLILICASMLMVQIEISHNETDLIILLEATIFGGAALLLLLFVCELGQVFSKLLSEIENEIMDFNWYLFPLKIQRVLPTILQVKQKPVVIKCFGSVSGSRKQFLKVLKSVYSYFMVLREFF